VQRARGAAAKPWRRSTRPTTAQIAAAFLVPEATIAKRISRAKQYIRAAGARFELPAEPERTERLGVVLHVLYLVFNEGYTSSGPALQRTDLTGEAIRLARLLYRLLPGQGEVAGLLALMLLTDARRAARTDADGRMAHTHRLEAVRAHLLEQAGDTAAARESYLRAAKMTASLPEQRYLTLRAARLNHPAPSTGPVSRLGVLGADHPCNG
jgi:predicted RNA polymerase sigma factor